MFELAQLRCFTTVATELNFRRAAERLNMTQPPLSRQIQLLEHHLGVELFTRSTRSVALTAAGRAFFIEAQNLLEQAQQAAVAAKRFAQGDIGSVTISFVGSAVYEFLPKVIAEARLKQPQVKIVLSEMNTYQQHEALRARRIDLGIVRSPLLETGYATECLVREPFVLAVPAGHPLASADSVGVEDLDGEPFLMYSHSAYPPFNELLTGMLRSARVAPQFVQWLGSSLTILALVNAGMGLALVPRCATSVVFKQVVFREIDLGEGVQSELHLVWRQDNDNPAFAMLLEGIRGAVREGL
ncbi:LysR substrate-binding domain-containing protein [Pseudomonas fluorescens]|uniref:LysR family transcriptional regulator n=1 Tax=Pseudomonas fluorescens TaxID=294 RepID=A0A944HHQ1_PSEFL|nr:LysR substrate-binding domain-containing protein [Pseudomonas fluorescens]MBT2294846.1 LysR family transcriptional regulator [Pseudomonas fluorescens]MBT2308462.1 LysR family transcriptional regulator [Pseudomonas fluorescens]MBT2311532.1 LysR family transcriptional regulator [Pseudomonas fluorescens]MBT2319803.1 LysR family transcriptional regulator [Pseudomonas fluorescens]MBT2331059.1 LysR family transcriptional regulator [Pseudomonas fluorescens]